MAREVFVAGVGDAQVRPLSRQGRPRAGRRCGAGSRSTTPGSASATSSSWPPGCLFQANAHGRPAHPPGDRTDRHPGDERRQRLRHRVVGVPRGLACTWRRASATSRSRSASSRWARWDCSAVAAARASAPKASSAAASCPPSSARPAWSTCGSTARRRRSSPRSRSRTTSTRRRTRSRSTRSRRRSSRSRRARRRLPEHALHVLSDRRRCRRGGRGVGREGAASSAPTVKVLASVLTSDPWGERDLTLPDVSTLTRNAAQGGLREGRRRSRRPSTSSSCTTASRPPSCCTTRTSACARTARPAA